MKKIACLAVAGILYFGIGNKTFAQKKKVLFLGNSYTNVNNLPNMISSCANSTGDTIINSQVTPGGYTLQGHSNYNPSLNLINQGGWDFVVLQEQSQRPSFPNAQVQTQVFPFARKLDSTINAADSCAETMFYMTWGRKNGDAQNCQFFQPLCTYQGMDSMLNLRYRQMADLNNAVVSPVGAVWNYIRSNHPQIELYAQDGSHPSLSGSFAAACTFYSVILRKDPNQIIYNPGIHNSDWVKIKSAAKAVAFDSLLKWKVGAYDLDAEFGTFHAGLQVQFIPFQSQGQHLWVFGDGNQSILANPTHTFSDTGFYYVSHRVTNCGSTEIFHDSVRIIHTGLNEKQVEQKQTFFYPNPSNGNMSCSVPSHEIKNVQVYDQSGRFIKNTPLEQNQISLSDLKPGVYFIRFRYQNQMLSRKLLLIR